MQTPPPLPEEQTSVAPPIITPPVLRQMTVAVPIRQGKRKSRWYSSIPWPVFLILLITIPPLIIFGPAAIGLAGFFGAIGIPVLLVFFVIALAIIGMVTLVRSIAAKPHASKYLLPIIHRIIQDETLRRVRKDLREAMTAAPTEPRKQPISGDDLAIQSALFKMGPLQFERHVMSFFQDIGLMAWVTQKSNDAGVDGFAKHPDGLIVVQCKHYARGNPVGRPMIQQFKGVVEENDAWRGYIVTTSYFTGGASASADKNERVYLVDLDELVRWHKGGFKL